MRPQLLAPDTALKATLWFVVLTAAATWPLVGSIASAVPSDLGDPLLNGWILAWNAEHLLAGLRGDSRTLGEIWHANIFHPARYALGYSELLITQTLLFLPVYALTGNSVLGYNLLFLAAFVLSGLGAYLLVRAMTDDWRAGFLAGVLFAFAPYRFHQSPHLQVMWSCWMPFVLYGLYQYFESTDRAALAEGLRRPARGARLAALGSVGQASGAGLQASGSGPRASGSAGAAANTRPPWLALAGAALALAAQNLSCGYYMLFFTPFVVLFALWQMAARGRLTNVRTWMALAATGAAAGALTVPFMTPYLALRGLGQRARGIEEVSSFAADSFAYLTAHAGLRVWGWLQTFPRPEGSLFPGVVPVALALVGLAAAVASSRQPMTTPSESSTWRRAVILVAGILGALHLVIFVGLFFGLEGRYDVGPLEIRLFSVDRPLFIATGAGALLLMLSRRARRAAAALLQSPAVFASVAAFVGFWLSLGPVARVLGDPLRDAGLYRVLYDFVPGFSGLRVPARFAMIVVLFLSVAAAFGYRTLAARLGTWTLPVLVALFLVESAVIPLGVNGRAYAIGHADPPDVVPTSPTALTRAIDRLPVDAVLIELPFGDISWEIRYLYLSTFHWRRMLNGYSGDIPSHYVRLRDATYLLPEEGGDRAWHLMRQMGATHAVVHEDAFGLERTREMRAWLEARGARLVTRADTSWIYAIPR